MHRSDADSLAVLEAGLLDGLDDREIGRGTAARAAEGLGAVIQVM
jgi:hypothetical protein